MVEQHYGTEVVRTALEEIRILKRSLSEDRLQLAQALIDWFGQLIVNRLGMDFAHFTTPAARATEFTLLSHQAIYQWVFEFTDEELVGAQQLMKMPVSELVPDINHVPSRVYGKIVTGALYFAQTAYNVQ